MAADITISPAPTISLLLSSRGNQSAADEARGQDKVPVQSANQENQTVPADTVNLSPQVQQAFEDVRKGDEKKQERELLNSKEPSTRSAAKIEFAYDIRGELITKYLDSSNRLVYQVPSELMLHLKSAGANPKTAVDTKV